MVIKIEEKHILITNFIKVCDFIKASCPSAKGQVYTKHTVNYWTSLDIQGNLITLSKGDHSSSKGEIKYNSDFILYIDFYSGSSRVEIPLELINLLELFLFEWECIVKPKVIESHILHSNIYSETFKA